MRTDDDPGRPRWAPDTLLDRVVVVTGAARGIGRACVTRVLECGGSVVAVDVDAAALDSLVAELSARRLRTVVADVNTEAGADAAVAVADRDFGGTHVLINNVGGMAAVPPQRFVDYELDQWEALLALNLRPAFLVTRAVLRSANADRLESIVNVGASLSERSSPHLSAYGAAKAAVTQLTRTLTVELGRSGVRVNCVAPGFTTTPASAQFVTPERRRDTEQAVPLGRVASPVEMADVIVFLASGFASFVSGQTIVVDGGLLTTTLRRPREWNEPREQ